MLFLSNVQNVMISKTVLKKKIQIFFQKYVLSSQQNLSYTIFGGIRSLNLAIPSASTTPNFPSISQCPMPSVLTPFSETSRFFVICGQCYVVYILGVHFVFSTSKCIHGSAHLSSFKQTLLQPLKVISFFMTSLFTSLHFLSHYWHPYCWGIIYLSDPQTQRLLFHWFHLL